MLVSEAREEATASAATPTAEPPLVFPPQARVLIVDDLPENRLVIGLYCDRFGVAHEAVESGRQAVAEARSGRFDVILMDICMPGMDGLAATRAIRALPGPVADAPIIAVTHAAEPGMVARYLACGLTDVVAKPVNAARLAEVLSKALAQAENLPAGSKARATA